MECTSVKLLCTSVWGNWSLMALWPQHQQHKSPPVIQLEGGREKWGFSSKQSKPCPSSLLLCLQLQGLCDRHWDETTWGTHTHTIRGGVCTMELTLGVLLKAWTKSNYCFSPWHFYHLVWSNSTPFSNPLKIGCFKGLLRLTLGPWC